MGNFVLQIGPYSSLILRISPWGNPFLLLLSLFLLYPYLAPSFLFPTVGFSFPGFQPYPPLPPSLSLSFSPGGGTAQGAARLAGASEHCPRRRQGAGARGRGSWRRRASRAAAARRRRARRGRGSGGPKCEADARGQRTGVARAEAERRAGVCGEGWRWRRRGAERAARVRRLRRAGSARRGRWAARAQAARSLGERPERRRAGCGRVGARGSGGACERASAGAELARRKHAVQEEQSGSRQRCAGAGSKRALERRLVGGVGRQAAV
jgi:hypothetical protein